MNGCDKTRPKHDIPSHGSQPGARGAAGAHTPKRTLAALALVLVQATANADSQRITTLEYDGAGNLVRIIAGVNVGAPVVSALVPAFIHRGSVVTVIAEGTGLFNASVGTAAVGLTVSNVESSSSTAMSFELEAALDAPIGPGTLTFENGLGTTPSSIFVAERVPIISTDPNPIGLRPDSAPRTVRLRFDAPFALA